MTPDEANQARRDAAVRRSRRIDALDARQLLNFIHRLAAIHPPTVDRILTEFTADPPKSRTEPKLHPVIFRGPVPPATGIIAVCLLLACKDWHVHLEDGHDLPDLDRLVREHSGIPS